MSRIPISNITHRSKSRNRGDQSSGRRSKSSASSRVSKSGETRQKSSVQKVYPPVTNPTKPKLITSTPQTPTRPYTQIDGLQAKPSTPKTPKSPKGRMTAIGGSIKKLLNGDSKSSSERKKSSSNSLNSDLRGNNVI